MNPEPIISYLQEQFDVFRKGTPGGFYHLGITIMGGKYAKTAVKFSASVDNVQRGESEADLETAVARCIEAGDPKARAKAIEEQILALQQERERILAKH